MNFIRDLEMMAFGSRMKNFSDTLMRDVSRIYREMDVDFEPRWFTFFILLYKRDDEMSVTQIAEELNQSHPAVIQVANILEEKGLIQARTDDADHRKRLVSLSGKGKDLAEKMSDTWEAIRKATEAYVLEVEPGFLKIIDTLEDSYRNFSLYKRIRKELADQMKENLEVVQYTDDYQDEFRRMNLLWIEEYLGVTDHDIKVLNDPEKMIIGKGGHIFILKHKDQVIGSFALMPVGKNDCELCKFTIIHHFRGMGFGEFLLNFALQTAKNLGYQITFLFSHDNLREATSLYKKSGFRIIDEPYPISDPTGRCSFVMSVNNQ